MRGTCKWTEEAVIDYLINENRDSATCQAFENHLPFCKQCQLQSAYWEDILGAKEVCSIKESGIQFKTPLLTRLKPRPPLKIKKQLYKTLFKKNVSRSNPKTEWTAASIIVVLVMITSLSLATQPTGEKKAPAFSQTGETTLIFNKI